MRFILRVHQGLTRKLAGHIRRRSEATDGQAVDCWVSVEGPHGALVLFWLLLKRPPGTDE